MAGFSPLHPRNAFENERLRFVHTNSSKGEKEAGIFDIARDRYSPRFNSNTIPLLLRSLRWKLLQILSSKQHEFINVVISSSTC